MTRTVKRRTGTGLDRRLAWTVALVACTIPACQRSAPPTSTQPAAPLISTKTPEDATRSLLGLLRGQLDAAARNDQVTLKQLRKLALDQLVPSDDILARLGSTSSSTEKERAQLLDVLVDSWAATIAFYADGLAVDQIRLAATGPAVRETSVDVPAHARGDSALLRVYCRRGKDNEWRVLGLEFAPRVTPNTGPSTSQATSTSRPGT